MSGTTSLSSNIGYGFASASILLVTAAQLLMKYGMSQLPTDINWLLSLEAVSMQLEMIGLVLLGLGCYVASLGCWMGALANLPLSKAYPLLAISYVLVYLCAIALPYFNEQISLNSLIGIGFITVGVLLVNRKNTD